MKSIISVFTCIMIGCAIGMMMARKKEGAGENKEHTFGISELTAPGSQSLEEIREKIIQSE